MTALFAKYGKIALALAAIFLSGQAIGWMLAWHSSDARHEAPSDPQRWTEHMLERLQKDLDLTPEQMGPIRTELMATAQQMERQRELALFQIHLQLLKLHDDLSIKLSSEQQKRLAQSRAKLAESTKVKFPRLLRETDAPADIKPTSTPHAPSQ